MNAQEQTIETIKKSSNGKVSHKAMQAQEQERKDTSAVILALMNSESCTYAIGKTSEQLATYATYSIGKFKVKGGDYQVTMWVDKKLKLVNPHTLSDENGATVGLVGLKVELKTYKQAGYRADNLGRKHSGYGRVSSSVYVFGTRNDKNQFVAKLFVEIKIRKGQLVVSPVTLLAGHEIEIKSTEYLNRDVENDKPVDERNLSIDNAYTRYNAFKAAQKARE